MPGSPDLCGSVPKRTVWDRRGRADRQGKSPLPRPVRPPPARPGAGELGRPAHPKASGTTQTPNSSMLARICSGSSVAWGKPRPRSDLGHPYTPTVGAMCSKDRSTVPPSPMRLARPLLDSQLPSVKPVPSRRAGSCADPPSNSRGPKSGELVEAPGPHHPPVAPCTGSAIVGATASRTTTPSRLSRPTLRLVRARNRSVFSRI